MFQSSPAFTGGRFAPAPVGARPGSRFNPRPPLQAGASRSGTSGRTYPARFQSSPAFTGGRFIWRRQIRHKSDLVSILARLYRRALRSSVNVSADVGSGFNPRPPLQAGASWFVRGALIASFWFQSSPAFTGGRFQRGEGGKSELKHSFNPRPPLQAGASGEDKDVTIVTVQFQSSPAFTGGRFSGTTQGYVYAYWFQSSPAFTGGRF